MTDGQKIDITEREWQQLWAKLDIIEARLMDLRERVLSLELKFIETGKDGADMRRAADIFQKKLLDIETEIIKAKAGWKVLVALGSFIGFLVGAALGLVRIWKGI